MNQTNFLLIAKRFHAQHANHMFFLQQFPYQVFSLPKTTTRTFYTTKNTRVSLSSDGFDPSQFHTYFIPNIFTPSPGRVFTVTPYSRSSTPLGYPLPPKPNKELDTANGRILTDPWLRHLLMSLDDNESL